ncbi:MAG: CapA family protein [Myxococcales bacterium]|nr:CapA family protein [Myxococcales bacterium]
MRVPACVLMVLIGHAVSAAEPCPPVRFALIAPPFEATQDVSTAALAAAWREGRVAASQATSGVLDRVLGARGTAPEIAVPDATHWAIVPAHELSPRWAVITVDGAHPLVGEGPLALCVPGAGHTIDASKLTTVVMSGTTALTGRTAKRIDSHGVADLVRWIKPFFASADVVHLSNEVSFVRDCKPETGQDGPFVFCARDRYVELLEALRATVIELTGSHLLDYGSRSLLRTLRMYEARGIRWFGGGRTQLEATEPVVIEHHGNKLAFVGCNAVNWWIKAISQGPGTANCDWPRMVWQIRDLKRRGYTPIATVQHREVRVHTPPPDLVRDLRRLAEAGAVFVEGSQAHVAHPWDVHYGAYVHYGPGNILFAQYRDRQREATVDKLYIHDGKLLTVEHIYTRTEHGQPRLLTAKERARFLGALAAAAGQLEPAAPAAVPPLAAATRVRPDSVVVRGRAQHLSVIAPARVEPGATYRLIVDLALTAGAPADAFVVHRTGRVLASGEQIAAYMRAKYPVDAAMLTITLDPEKVVPARKKRRTRLARS